MEQQHGDNTRLASFRQRLNELRARAAQTTLDIYQLCAELDLDGAWRLDGCRNFGQWLSREGLNANIYSGYKDAVALFGMARLANIGLSAAREIARLVQEQSGNVADVQAFATLIYDAANAKIGGFRADTGHLPSDAYAKQLVRDAANALGLRVQTQESSASLRQRYARILAALVQGIELSDNCRCYTCAIVRNELRKAGFQTPAAQDCA